MPRCACATRRRSPPRTTAGAASLLRRHDLAVTAEQPREDEPAEAAARRQEALDAVRARSLPLASIDTAALRPVVSTYSRHQGQAANYVLSQVARLLTGAGLDDPAQELRSYVPVTTARRWSGHKSAKVLLDVYWGACPTTTSATPPSLTELLPHQAGAQVGSLLLSLPPTPTSGAGSA